MITITMPMWFAISLTIYLALYIIAKIVKATLNEIENKRNRELMEIEKNVRFIK